MRRFTRALALACAALAITAASAQAHARMSPPVTTPDLQWYTLAVPTENDDNTTTKIELKVPEGFNIDSYGAVPGWTRSVSQSGSGDSATVHSVTWTGGHTPTDEDSVFGLLASTSGAKTYRFEVIQTYTSGQTVDWNGSESSDSPAPTVTIKKSLGSSGWPVGAWIAIGVAVLAALLALVALLARGSSSTGISGGAGEGEGRSLA